MRPGAVRSGKVELLLVVEGVITFKGNRPCSLNHMHNSVNIKPSFEVTRRLISISDLRSSRQTFRKTLIAVLCYIQQAVFVGTDDQ